MKASDNDLTQMADVFSFEFFKLRTSSEDLMWERSPRGSSLLEHHIKQLYKEVVKRHINLLNEKEETLNLRNQFIGLAMQGILANSSDDLIRLDGEQLSKMAIGYADALIYELNKEQNEKADNLQT